MTKTLLNNSYCAAFLLGSGLALSGCVSIPEDTFADLGSSIPVPPPPPPANARVGPVAQPTLGTSPPPPVTVADIERVENSTSDETLAFRMVQAARTVSLASDPKSTTSDSATDAGGATVFLDIPADPDPDANPSVRLTLGNAALGVTNLALQLDPSERFYEATLADGRTVTLALDSINQNSAAGGSEFAWAT